MRVCHCHNVNDRELKAAVCSASVGGSDCSRALLAGTSCGGCLPLVEEIVEGTLAEIAGSKAVHPVLASRVRFDAERVAS